MIRVILKDFYTGSAFDAYRFFGAHIQPEGVMFRTYAPNAVSIEVIGEFNNWNGYYMNKEGSSGVFSLYVANASAGQLYKYRIHSNNGSVFDKTDPYAFGMELRPNSASVIVDTYSFKFTDSEWMQKRSKNYDAPMNIYEIHAGSWKMLEDNTDEPSSIEKRWHTYRELAAPLIEYCKAHHFTHIELMPVAEHPADCSWGYQVTGFYSPTSRYGTPDDLKYFINECHRAGIGVFTDFVPVHFAVDGYALEKFDGTPLYEYPNGYNEWGSLNFNYYRGEVRSFMQSAANYWLSEFHFDGIRMDAISNIIYWQGDANRGVNDGAVQFIRNMNIGLHKIHPSAILMAEDSTNFLKVTAPVEYDGLGFDYKWDMGWMNDTLDFFRTPPAERPVHYYKITFSMQYFYNELFVLPLSHDETVHGKAAIIQKMWGDYDVKFPQCRAFYAYMFTHPGKKLNFMGNEFAQFREWDETKELDWFMLKYPKHDSFRRFITDLAQLYCTNPALHCEEYSMQSFKWLEADAVSDCVYAYRRTSGGKSVVVVLNFSDKEYKNYSIPCDEELCLTEILNSDSDIYSGTTPTVKKEAITALPLPKGRYSYSFSDDLPPFSAKIYDASPKK